MASNATAYSDKDRAALTAKELLLARNDDGEMDWKTLGNIITASALGEALCGSYADFKYGKMNSRDFRPDVQWKFAYEEKDVLVFKKTNENSIMSLMGRGVIDMPLRTVADFISDMDNCSLWNKFMVEARIVQPLSKSDTHTSFLGYFLHESKHCFVKTRRDFLMFVHSTFIDGKFVYSGISVEHPLCPPVRRLTRAECCLGSGWVLEPFEGSETQTLATYVANVNLCLPLPPIMLNRLLSSQPLTVHFVREQLMQRVSPSPHHEPTHQNRFGEQASTQLAISENGGNVSSSLEDSDQYVSSFFFIGYNASLKRYEEPMAVGDFMYQSQVPHSKPAKRRPRSPSPALPSEERGGGGGGGGGRNEASESLQETEIGARTLLRNDDADGCSESPVSSRCSEDDKRTVYRPPAQSLQQQNHFHNVM